MSNSTNETITFFSGSKAKGTLKVVPMEQAQWTIIPKDIVSKKQLAYIEKKLSMRAEQSTEDANKWFLRKTNSYSLDQVLS